MKYVGLNANLTLLFRLNRRKLTKQTETQIIDPKADEIAHTIRIGNVNASVRAKMISTVLKLACQIGKYAHN